MGRPRKYQSDAERAAAYRRRLAKNTVRVDRRTWERLQASLGRLQAAVEEAARAGDYTARLAQAERAETMLNVLAEHFEIMGKSRY